MTHSGLKIKVPSEHLSIPKTYYSLQVHHDIERGNSESNETLAFYASYSLRLVAMMLVCVLSTMGDQLKSIHFQRSKSTQTRREMTDRV